MDVDAAAKEIEAIAQQLPAPTSDCCTRKNCYLCEGTNSLVGIHPLFPKLYRVAKELRTAVVQARPGETLDDVLRREGLELAEETCTTCEGDGFVTDYTVDDPSVPSHFRCTECRCGRVVAEDALEVRVAGQVRYARRKI